VESVKQTLTASSTMEAEYITCYHASCQDIWLRNFISGLVIMDTITKPLKIFCNNSVAVSFSLNTGSSSQSEYIDIKYLFAREKVVKSHICVVHTPTEHMLADLLIKGLSPRVFQKHVTHIVLLESFVLLS